jgi:ubiquitin-conjugating enzyme E2 Q
MRKSGVLFIFTCEKIIRNGLWFKTIAHGRAYGHGASPSDESFGIEFNKSSGVYLAKEGTTSTGGYSATGVTWKKSFIQASNCTALAEIVNLPHKFVNKDPCFVVNRTDWIFW